MENDFTRVRAAFLQECCVNDATIAQVCDNARFCGLICIHINARGNDNVLSPGPRPILKHVFLQNPRFKNDIVEYYRAKGFAWVDVLVVNRFDWKIFLTPQDARQDLPPPPRPQEHRQEHHRNRTWQPPAPTPQFYPPPAAAQQMV